MAQKEWSWDTMFVLQKDSLHCDVLRTFGKILEWWTEDQEKVTSSAIFWTKYCQWLLSTVFHLGICLLLSLVASNISIRLWVNSALLKNVCYQQKHFAFSVSVYLSSALSTCIKSLLVGASIPWGVSQPVQGCTFCNFLLKK